MQLKKTKSHTSTRKKASTTSSTQRGKSKAAKDEAAQLRREKKLEELTLRAFRMAYESNQRGEFQRL